MHFLLLGASGRTGKLLVSELLSQNHTAVALVRNASSLTPRSGLTVVTGSPLSKDDIRKTLSAAPGQLPEATIITLNTNRKSDNPFAAQVSPPRLLADSCANACEVLEEAGIRRLVFMSTAGAGDSWANTPWLSKVMLGWTNIKHALEDHNLVDKEIRQTNMDWTLVRPMLLKFEEVNTPAAADKKIKLMGSRGEGMSVTDAITAASVARFLVKVAVEGLYIKESIVIKN